MERNSIAAIVWTCRIARAQFEALIAAETRCCTWNSFEICYCPTYRDEAVRAAETLCGTGDMQPWCDLSSAT
jgi:hypothetical protein